MEDEAPQPPAPAPRPHLPSHKQNRINIWRSEVASLTPQPPCSSAQSTTTTTSSSSSGASSAILAVAEDDAGAARRPSFWRRLTKRIRGKGGADAEEEESGAVANGLRTEMYKEELGAWQTPASPAADAVSSEGGRGLKDKQERLERAARLLNQAAEKP